ncbi:MAG: hypothetical protein HW412_1768 [Bacteroidetes bacterium]|nr:hypothetical protein [Bacteroidota bacterium]
MVTGSYPPQPCGVGDYSFRLVHELQAAGVIVDVVTTRSSDRREMNEVRYSLTDWKLLNWRSAVAWMATQTYDLVHVQYPARFYGYIPDLAFLTFMLKKRMPGIPVVVTIHEFGIVHLLRKLTIAFIVAKADAVIVTAQSEQVAFERWMPWTRKKVHLIHMAATLPTLPVSQVEKEAVRQRYGINAGEIVLGYFGFLHPNKGVERLIRAFALVHARYPHTRLMIMSLRELEKNEFHRSLTKLVTDLGLEQAVIWTGFLDPESLSRHIGSIDIAVLPFAEGVSLRRLSFMTALDHGIPTVTTRGKVEPGSLGLEDGVDAMFASAGDSPQSLADVINKLIDFPNLRRTLQVNGKAWMKPYQWPSVVPQSLVLYSAMKGTRFSLPKIANNTLET